MPRQLRGQFVVRGQQLPTLYLCTKFEKRSFDRLRNIERCEISKLGHVIHATPTYGQFAIYEQELPAVCQYAKFEERSFIRDEDIAHFTSKD